MISIQHKKLNHYGFSHHLLLPLLAIVVAGVIGVATSRLSSAATYDGSCVKKSFSTSSPKSTCVKHIQTIVGTTSDGIYGPKTKAAVKKMTGDTSVKASSAAWNTICDAGRLAGSGAKYTAYKKACLRAVKVAYKTRVCTYSTPSIKTEPPKKLDCLARKTFKTEKSAKKQQAKNYKLAEQYQKDCAAYMVAINLGPERVYYKRLVADFDIRYVGAKRVSGVIQKVDSSTGAVIQ
jgi:hypothetical protein